MKRRSSEEQILNVLKKQNACLSVKEIIRRHGIAERISCRWRLKFGSMEVLYAKQLRVLERKMPS